MVITPHALTGALAGRDKSLARAGWMGLRTHYVLDRIPHQDYPLDHKLSPLFLGLDLALTGYLLRNSTRSEKVGAAAALLPDVLSVLNRRGYLPNHPVTATLQYIHDKNHTKRQVHPVVGVGIQVFYTLAAAQKLQEKNP